MGQLEVSCFAEGSDNTLYALAYGYDLNSNPGQSRMDNAVAILLKSNSSPANPSSLTWKVVGATRKSELYTLQDMSCIVDPSGSFLAWSYRALRKAEPGATFRPGGIRYDPAANGNGGWVNVETPLRYSWTYTAEGSGLIYVKDATGKYKFYHLYIDNQGMFQFGALNTAVTPNMMENIETKWDAKSTVPSQINGMTLSATKLFLWGYSISTGNVFGLADLPQVEPLPASPPTFQYTNSTTNLDCSSPRALNDKVYKFCEVRLTHGKEYQLHALDGIKPLDPVNMPNLPIPTLYTKSQSGFFGDASTTYMLLQSGTLTPSSFSDGEYRLEAVALTGPSAGSLLVPNNITVSDSFAYYPGDGSGSGSGSGSTSQGLPVALRWVIGICSVLIVLCCVGCIVCCFRRKKVVIKPVIQQTPAPA